MNISSVDSSATALRSLTPAPTDGREPRTQPAKTAGEVPSAEAVAQTGVAATSEAQAARQKPGSPEAVKQAVETIQQVVETMTRDLRFSFDDDLNRTVIKVVDTKTDEVIRQIPAEEVLEIARSLNKLQGLLVRQTA